MPAKWEYHYVQIGPRVVRTLQQWKTLFDDLGEEGWEHTGTITTVDDGDHIVFKRPL